MKSYTKTVSVFPIECPICNKQFKGSSSKDADRQLNHHYYFKHTGLSSKCECSHYKTEHTEHHGCNKCKCKKFKENGK